MVDQPSVILFPVCWHTCDFSSSAKTSRSCYLEGQAPVQDIGFCVLEFGLILSGVQFFFFPAVASTGASAVGEWSEQQTELHSNL